MFSVFPEKEITRQQRRLVGIPVETNFDAIFDYNAAPSSIFSSTGLWDASNKKLRNKANKGKKGDEQKESWLSWTTEARVRCSVVSKWCMLVLVRPTLFGKRVERSGKGRSYIGFPPLLSELRFDACVVNKPDRPHEHMRSNDGEDDEEIGRGRGTGSAGKEYGESMRNVLQPSTFSSSFPFLCIQTRSFWLPLNGRQELYILFFSSRTYNPVHCGK